MATKAKEKTAAHGAKEFTNHTEKAQPSKAPAKGVAAEAVKAVTTVKATNDKEFGAILGKIKTSSDLLAGYIHQAGLYALSQVNLHGQTHYGLALIDAMGQKHDKVRVLKWLIKFGKFAYKNGVLIYKKRKDIGPENVDKVLEDADATPYWELTPQPDMSVTFDYLSMLKSIVQKHSSIPNLQEKGKTVTEKNVGVLSEVEKLLKKFEPQTA